EIAKQPDLSRFLDKCSMEAAKSCASYLLGDVSHIINSSGMALKDSRLTPSELCKIVRALKNNEINGAAAKIILSEIFINGGSFKDIACRLKLIQMTDDTELSRIVKSVFESNPKAISDYKSGKSAALSYLVGQCMRAACGRGNHRRFIEMIKNAICEEN
ncbi:MAG: GatB/YqeY domain-containing protein, partial [Clostridia bacterium]